MQSSKSTITVDAILIASPKPEKLAEFYQKGFRLEPYRRFGEDHVGLNLQNTYLGFDRIAEADAANRSAVSIWFKVADIHTAFDQLVDMGATVKYAPTAEESPGEMLAMLYDPEGNSIGLISPLPTPENA
jgi:predicted enzyme related to lactoylglutathione lyase